MTNNEDRLALAQFCGRKGEATRLVLSQKDDISRWIEEGWPLVAIYRLLKSKDMATMRYDTFRKAVRKIFGSKKSHSSNNSLQHDKQQDKQRTPINRQRPHEMQRKEKEKFVTLSGVDLIGLDKKE